VYFYLVLAPLNGTRRITFVRNLVSISHEKERMM
jgi:hypothetical protein